MEFEFDPVKSAKNAKERGLPFDLAAELEWRKAVISIDDRFMYGEERRVAFVPMRGRLYVVCCVFRGKVRRIISFRRPINKRSDSMPKRPLTNKDGEVRPLTAEDFKHFRPIAEVDPGMIEAAEQFRRRGRPVIGDAPKLHIGFRLAADVVNAIRATGKGYNARVEKVLRDALAKGKL